MVVRGSMSSVGLSHYSGAMSVVRGMWIMIALLTIPLIWGVLLYGFRALGLVAVSVLTAVVAEALVLSLQLRGKNLFRELTNGSALLCGLLLGLSLPVTAHWLVAVIGALFAIVVVKWGGGGFGVNWLNPALAGRLCVQLAWPEGLRVHDWGRSLISGIGWNVDSISVAADLRQIKEQLMEGGRIIRPLSLIEREFSSLDTLITGFLNEQILVPQGVVLPAGYVDYFLGFRYGAIGESSIIIILLVSVFLLAKGIISWHVPVGGFVALSLLTLSLAGVFRGVAAFPGDVLFALFRGGFLFTLMFMATDPVTSPYSGKGKLLFGLGFGILTFVLWEASVLPESSMLALLMMNMLCPLINSSIRRKPLSQRIVYD